MKYKDLRDFMAQLESLGELHRLHEPVSARLEMTALADRVLRAEGPAILVTKPVGYKIPALVNLFGVPRRVALGMGAQGLAGLRDVGRVLASLKEPEPPKGLKDAGRLMGMVKALWDMKPSVVRSAPCQDVVLQGAEIDLGALPIQTCWPGDAGPLITWGLVITRGPQTVPQPRARQNLGIYRQQVIGRREVVMRWLAHRGGALDFRDFTRASPGRPFPIAVALGADPATILGAVTPVPDTLSEYQFAGLLRGGRTEVVDTSVGDGALRLQAPATAEFVLEGHIPLAPPGYAGESEFGVKLSERDGYLHALEGPFGDHTGYYSLADYYPLVHVTAVTARRDPIYPATLVGPPPMEDYYLGHATERIFLPLLKLTVPEIVDYHMPAAGIFHNLVFVAIDKQYPGQAYKVMNALWGAGLKSLAKVLVVVDKEVNVRNPQEAWWVALNNIDPERDVRFTMGPVDVLDHGSRAFTYGSKMGIDATRKWPEEGFTRNWPKVIEMDDATKARVDALWPRLGLPTP
jgi:4-hydroxy-3-polyprenylbenzoate decarboxylase